MRDQLKPLFLGSFATLVVATALFGAQAFADSTVARTNATPQDKEPVGFIQVGSTKPYPVVTISDENSHFSLAADLIDKVDAFDVGEGNLEVHVYTYHDISGDMKEQFQITVKKSEHQKYVESVNKLRK